MKIFFGLTVILLLMISCKQKNINSEENAKTENKADETDTLNAEAAFSVEATKALLILNPTVEAMKKNAEKMKAQYGEDGLAEVGSDIAFFIDEAQHFAVSKGLKVYTTAMPLVLFQKEDGSAFRLENRVEGIGSELYFFDGKKDPVKINQIPMLSDGNEYKAYFEK